MKIEAVILTCDLEEDTLTVSLPKDFWKHNAIRRGKVAIETDAINPIKEAQ